MDSLLFLEQVECLLVLSNARLEAGPLAVVGAATAQVEVLAAELVRHLGEFVP